MKYFHELSFSVLEISRWKHGCDYHRDKSRDFEQRDHTSNAMVPEKNVNVPISFEEALDRTGDYYFVAYENKLVIMLFDC